MTRSGGSAVATFAAPHSQNITQVIDFHFVGVGAHLFQDDGAHLALIARDTTGCGEAFQELELGRADPR